MLVTALQRSLKTRITLWVLALLLAGMWALVLLAQQRLRQELQLQLQERQMAVATLLGQEMEQALQERTQALQSVAAVLSAALERYPDDLPERLTSRTVLQQMFTGGTFVTDSAGSVLAAYPHTVFHTASALHQGFSSYVQAALGGLTVISHPMAGPDGQYPIVALATPVRGMDGRVLGTLVGLVNLSQPNFVDAVQLLSERQLGDYYVIARQTRTIVAASDRRRVLEALPPVGVNPEMDRFIRGALQESTVAPMGKGRFWHRPGMWRCPTGWWWWCSPRRKPLPRCSSCSAKFWPVPWRSRCWWWAPCGGCCAASCSRSNALPASSAPWRRARARWRR